MTRVRAKRASGDQQPTCPHPLRKYILAEYHATKTSYVSFGLLLRSESYNNNARAVQFLPAGLSENRFIFGGRFLSS